MAEPYAGARGAEMAAEVGSASLTGDHDRDAISRDSSAAEVYGCELWSSKRQDLLFLGFAYLISLIDESLG